MKSKFLALFSREFSGRLWQAWVFPLAAALFQPLLYWLAVREMYEPARFEELYASSAAPILLAVLFAALTGLKTAAQESSVSVVPRPDTETKAALYPTGKAPLQACSLIKLPVTD